MTGWAHALAVVAIVDKFEGIPDADASGTLGVGFARREPVYATERTITRSHERHPRLRQAPPRRIRGSTTGPESAPQVHRGTRCPCPQQAWLESEVGDEAWGVVDRPLIAKRWPSCSVEAAAISYARRVQSKRRPFSDRRKPLSVASRRVIAPRADRGLATTRATRGHGARASGAVVGATVCDEPEPVVALS